MCSSGHHAKTLLVKYLGEAKFYGEIECRAKVTELAPESEGRVAAGTSEFSVGRV